MSDLILYHGTTADFSVVDLKHCKDKKDFGKGFYLTDIKEQTIEYIILWNYILII